MDTTAGVHLQIMVKSDASPLRLSPVDILAHVMLGLIWPHSTMHSYKFERRFPCCQGLRVRSCLAYGGQNA